MFGLISIKEFSKELNKPESTIYGWKNGGAIPLSCFKQIGGTWFVRVKEMQEELAK